MNPFAIFVATADYETTQKTFNCLTAALFTDKNIANGIQNYFVEKNENPEAFCRWRGMECRYSIPHWFLLARTKVQRADWEVDLSWLPPSLWYVHLDAVVVRSNIILRHLPRELEYFSLKRGTFTRGHSPVSSINTADFPPNLTEFLLDVHAPLCGTLTISSLPANMTLLAIQNCRIKSVFVSNDGLPERLRHVFLENTRSKLYATGNEPVDPRLRLSTGENEGQSKSKYYLGYQCRAHDLERNVLLAYRDGLVKK